MRDLSLVEPNMGLEVEEEERSLIIDLKRHARLDRIAGCLGLCRLEEEEEEERF